MARRAPWGGLPGTAAPCPPAPLRLPSLSACCVAAICALQNAAIIGLIFRLGTVARATQLLLTAALAAAGWWLFGGACRPALLTALQTGSVALLALGGRLPQVRAPCRRFPKHACAGAQKSPPSCCLLACTRQGTFRCLMPPAGPLAPIQHRLC